jgi:hypothetical protein
LFLAVLCGGLWRRISVGFFGLIGITEVHHLIETIHAGRYTPGTVTAIPYVAAGILLLRALVGELHTDRSGATTPASPVA